MAAKSKAQEKREYQYGLRRGIEMPNEFIAAWSPEVGNGGLPMPDWVKGLYRRVTKEFVKRAPVDEATIHGEWLGSRCAYARSIILGEFSLSRQQVRCLKQMLRLMENSILMETQRYLRQKPDQASRFLQGLSRGLATEPGGASKETSATSVYWHILAHWREVETFRSCTELRNWLLLRFPDDVVGKSKRVEKICQRIGLRFKARGRPRRRNSDT